jgi:hypothetical protein
MTSDQMQFVDFYCLRRGDEVSQKACRAAMPFLERQPGDRSLTSGDPFAEQPGFTKAGGGRDDGQFALQTLA